MLKPFSGEKILSQRNGAQKWRFWGNGGRNLRFWFCCPQKALPCTEPRRLTYFVSKLVRRLGSSLSQEPPPQKIAELLCAEGHEITHAQNRNPWTDFDKILNGGRYHRRSYPHKFWWPSVKGFFWERGVKFPPFPSSLQHSRTTVRACDKK